MRICLDPQGGGEDASGGSKWNEGAYQLAIAEKISRALEKAGHKVILTRTGNQKTRLAWRTVVANRARVHLYIALGSSWDRDPAERGAETYCFRRGGRGERLAYCIQAALAARLGTVDRGVKEGWRYHSGKRPLYVLGHTLAPAVLVRPGFRSNAADAACLQSADGQARIAAAVAAGVAEYLGDKRKRR